MTHSSKLMKMTAQEYMEFEDRASLRHEYVDGRIFAMTGVTKRHNIIAGNIYSILRANLRGGRCRAYMSDVKARVESANSFYYPDVMVSCEAFDKKSTFTACPVLIVEVLSRSTAAIDRREKMLAYRQIESMKEYLIVHQTKQRVEFHRKNENGSWDIFEFEPGAEMVLESMPGGSVKIHMDSVYEDVDWQHDNDWTVRESAAEDWNEDGMIDW